MSGLAKRSKINLKILEIFIVFCNKLNITVSFNTPYFLTIYRING